jgi:hypothetical protein
MLHQLARAPKLGLQLDLACIYRRADARHPVIHVVCVQYRQFTGAMQHAARVLQCFSCGKGLLNCHISCGAGWCLYLIANTLHQQKKLSFNGVIPSHGS